MDKRTNYIKWDSYFMMIAFLSSLRSKDPNTRHGACIVDNDNIIRSVGYNGFPKGCSDEDFPWGKEGDIANTKVPYVVHAELNAILNSRSPLSNCKMYLYSEKGYYPCWDCAKAIIQSGIKEIIIAFALNDDTDVYQWYPTKKMFAASGVKITLLEYDQLFNDIDIFIATANEIKDKIRTQIRNGDITVKISNNTVMPCIKCGAIPNIAMDSGGFHEVRCNCGNHVSFHCTENRAIEVWNWSNCYR